MQFADDDTFRNRPCKPNDNWYIASEIRLGRGRFCFNGSGRVYSDAVPWLLEVKETRAQVIGREQDTIVQSPKKKAAHAVQSETQLDQGRVLLQRHDQGACS